MVATATQSSSSSRMVSRETVGKAVDALLKWMRARAEQQQKAQLLDADDDLLYIVLTLKRIPPKSRTNPYRIPLPHPLYESPVTSACLILDDRNRPAGRRSSSSSSSLTTAAAALDRARSLSLPIADAISLSALATDYRPYEARRRLCDSHDLFFADRAILPLLPRLLGKHFFKKKKIPLPLDLSRPGWPEQLRACLRSTLLHLRTGSCSGLKVGRLSMDRDQIVDNVMSAIEGAMAHVPKRWADVRSIHVKAVNSVALPIYQVLPVLGLKIEVQVPVPRVPQKKDEIDKDVEQPIGEAEALQEEEEPKMKKTREVMQKKGRRIYEVQSMDTANDLDLEEFLIGESVDEGIMEEEEREARMEARMDKKRKKNKTKEGVEVSIFKEKKKKKREDGIQNDKEEDSNRKGRDESMVAVAKKKELKNDGKVKKEKDKKGRKHSSVDDEVTDESYDVGKNCDVDIGSGDNEQKKMGAGKNMKTAKKDANVKKGKDKRSKSDGSEDNDRNHKDDGAKESDNRMAGKKKVMKEMKRQKRKWLE